MSQPESLAGGKVELHAGDCVDVLSTLPAESIDACVTDPPYHLTSIVKRFGSPTAAPAKAGKTGAYARASAGFMGKQWDGGDVAFQVETWETIFRVLKPGAHLLAFGGTRTYHRMVCAIEDAGFEIRDQLAWAYGSGFPKSHDVSKAIDREMGGAREQVRVPGFEARNPKATGGGKDGTQGAKRPWIEEAQRRGYHEKDGPIPVTDAAKQWAGFGTALKPAWEPIVLARKPLIGTVAQNVLAHGTGALNIDGCRIGTEEDTSRVTNAAIRGGNLVSGRTEHGPIGGGHDLGRWPANIVHDGSEEVLAAFPESAGQNGSVSGGEPSSVIDNVYGARERVPFGARGDNAGSAARFFYTAKADSDDRIGSKHPTVKPVDLMQWLVRLVTPPGGVVLDPFAGTGTTGEAAFREGFRAVLIEREVEYQADIRRRMALALAGPDERKRESVKARGQVADAGPLFGGSEGTQTRGGADRFTECSRTNDRPDRAQEVNEAFGGPFGGGDLKIS